LGNTQDWAHENKIIGMQIKINNPVYIVEEET
jgi:hypothetical protein